MGLTCLIGDSRQTGAVVSVAEWWQAYRWLDSGAMVTWQVLGVGLHMSRHGHKPPASSINCCLHSRRWRWGPQTSEIHSVVRSVLFCSTSGRDIRGSGRRGSDVFRDIGRRIPVATGEQRSTEFLFQRLSIAVQRGNAASVVGTASSDCCLDDVFYLWCFFNGNIDADIG